MKLAQRAETSIALALQSSRGRKGTAAFCVLTIVDDEMNAARDVFGANVNIPASPYFVKNTSLSSEYDVVIRKASDRGNHPAGEAVKDFIEDFRPEFILLIGVAGGNSQADGVAKGDVVVADFVDYYEVRKMIGGKSLARKSPYDHPSLYLRENFVDPRRAGSNWIPLITLKRPDGIGVPKLIIGNLVAGEKLLSDPDNPVQKKILQEFDKAAAVDMESYGVARSVFNARKSVYYNPQYLVIRGISDLVDVADEDNDEQRRIWRKYASCAAAAFGRCLVEAVLAQNESVNLTGMAVNRRGLRERWRNCVKSISDWLNR